MAGISWKTEIDIKKTGFTCNPFERDDEPFNGSEKKIAFDVKINKVMKIILCAL